MASRRGSSWVVAALVAGAWIWTTLDPKPVDTPRSQSTTTPTAQSANPSEEKPNVVDPPPPPKVAVQEWEAAAETIAPAAAQTFYTTAKVRMRAQPSTNAKIVRTLGAGEIVESLSRQGDWHNITVGATTGWIRGDFLSSSAPAAPPKPQVDVSPPAPLVTAEAKPNRRAKVAEQEHQSAGDPIREAYVGTCDCPYDVKRNGAHCGGTSAWSRPGGRSPVCFVGE